MTMDLMAQLQAASGGTVRRKQAPMDLTEVKEKIRAALSSSPITLKKLTAATGVSASVTRKAVYEMIAVGTARAVSPGEFKRRVAFVAPR